LETQNIVEFNHKAVKKMYDDFGADLPLLVTKIMPIKDIVEKLFSKNIEDIWNRLGFDDKNQLKKVSINFVGSITLNFIPLTKNVVIKYLESAERNRINSLITINDGEINSSITDYAKLFGAWKKGHHMSLGVVTS